MDKLYIFHTIYACVCDPIIIGTVHLFSTTLRCWCVSGMSWCHIVCSCNTSSLVFIILLKKIYYLSLINSVKKYSDNKQIIELNKKYLRNSIFLNKNMYVAVNIIIVIRRYPAGDCLDKKPRKKNIGIKNQ